MKSKLLAGLSLIFLLWPLSSSSSPAKDAERFINGITSDAVSILKREDLTDDMKQRKLKVMFDRVVDSFWIGRFAAGNHWRSFTDDQKSRYLLAYKEHLARRYVPKFRSYTGNQVKVINMKEVRSGEYFVDTQIISPVDNNTLRVAYRIRRKVGEPTYKVFDIIAEGVSLIISQRSEFSNILSDQGIESLILSLKK